MSMSKLAAGIGAAVLAATMSLPATAAEPSHHATMSKGAITDISAAHRYYRHHYVRHYSHRYGGYHRHYYGHRYGSYGPYYGYGGPRAYVALPFVHFGIW